MRGVDRPEVGVAADVVPGHGRDDVAAAPLLERAGLLADDEERAGDALLGHRLGQPFGDVVDPLGFGRDVVLGVERDDEEGVTGTFFVIGEKARSLEKRGRRDVIAAMARHDRAGETRRGLEDLTEP